jgi:hypothetical protein
MRILRGASDVSREIMPWLEFAPMCPFEIAKGNFSPLCFSVHHAKAWNHSENPGVSGFYSREVQ